MLGDIFCTKKQFSQSTVVLLKLKAHSMPWCEVTPDCRGTNCKFCTSK